MPERGVIILGSSNSNGDTARLCRYVSERTGFPIIDLRGLDISDFDYEHRNRDDDFLPTIRGVVENYDLIVLATPVYWYTMSATLKRFLDRLTDCLTIEKETGRKLRDMSLAVISCANDAHVREGFYVPFELSAGYLGMTYLGAVHGFVTDGAIDGEVATGLRRFAGLLTRPS